MAWPDCDCIGCVYREIAQRLWVGLFSAWGEWPEKDYRRPHVFGVALTPAQVGEVFQVMVNTTATSNFNKTFDVVQFGGIHSWTREEKRPPWYRRIFNKRSKK